MQGEVQGRRPQEIDRRRLCPGHRLRQPPGDRRQRQPGPGHVGLHPRRRKAEGADARHGFDAGRNGRKVAASQGRDGGTGDGDKPRLQLPRCRNDIRAQSLVVAQDRLHLCQAREKDQAVAVIPAGLIVGVVRRVAAGGVVHNGHPAQLKQGRADAGNIGGVGR